MQKRFTCFFDTVNPNCKKCINKCEKNVKLENKNILETFLLTKFKKQKNF